MTWLIIALLMAALLTGIYGGQRGFLCDSRLDLATRKEAGLIAELTALLDQNEAYGYFMVLQKLGRKPGEVSKKLAEVRATIAQMGGTPKPLPPRLTEALVENRVHEDERQSPLLSPG